MEIFYQISPSSIAEDFIAKIYEANAPDAEIASQNIAAPHTAPASITFSGLDKIPHVVRLFGATSGTLLHNYDVIPTEDIISIFDDIKFKIGDGGALTPAAGSSIYTNPVLVGLATDDFSIWRNGYGFLLPGIHFTFNSTTGTISLITPDQFGDGEEFLISRKSQSIKTAVNDSVVGKQFGGNSTIPEIFIDVNSTVNYAPSHLRHLIRLSGANANYVLTGAIPIGYIFRVTNFGVYADITDKGKVTFDNAPLLWGSTPKTELAIPFTGAFEFEFDGTNWNCTMYNALSEDNLPKIVYAASVNLGVIGNDDASQLFTFNIPFQTGINDYRVVGNLVGRSTDPNQDNDCTFIVTQKLSTTFKIKIRKLQNVTPNLAFDFVIVK